MLCFEGENEVSWRLFVIPAVLLSRRVGGCSSLRGSRIAAIHIPNEWQPFTSGMNYEVCVSLCASSHTWMRVELG